MKCDLYGRLKQTDELVAINDALIYDCDADSANDVKKRIADSPRGRVKLTFVKGAHRDAVLDALHDPPKPPKGVARANSILNTSADRLPGAGLRERAAAAEASAYDAQSSSGPESGDCNVPSTRVVSRCYASNKAPALRDSTERRSLVQRRAETSGN